MDFTAFHLGSPSLSIPDSWGGGRGASCGPEWARPCLEEVRLWQVPAVSALCPSRDISEAEYAFVSQFLL